MEQEINQLISTKNTTRIIGILFIAGMVAGIFSVVSVFSDVPVRHYLWSD